MCYNIHQDHCRRMDLKKILHEKPELICTQWTATNFQCHCCVTINSTARSASTINDKLMRSNARKWQSIQAQLPHEGKVLTPNWRSWCYYNEEKMLYPARLKSTDNCWSREQSPKNWNHAFSRYPIRCQDLGLRYIISSVALP